MGEVRIRGNCPAVERLETSRAMRDNASSSVFDLAGKGGVLKASEICARAANLVGGNREDEHGEKLQNFGNIARLWHAYLLCRRYDSDPLNAADVGHMMVLMKIARTQTGKFNIDDYVDAAGYAGCAAQVAQDLATR